MHIIDEEQNTPGCQLQLTAQNTQHNTNKLQILLDNNITFPQALGGKALLISREPPNQPEVDSHKKQQAAYTFMPTGESEPAKSKMSLLTPYLHHQLNHRP